MNFEAENTGEQSTKLAKPFLKWAGGKSQLLGQIKPYFPQALHEGEIATYIEPFIGGGAVFFHVAQHFAIPNLVIADINPELVLIYRTIQATVELVIENLLALQSQYEQASLPGREKLYYQIRTQVNQQRPCLNLHQIEQPEIARTAQLLFLNRTCFNGLFRLNSQGEFNVPFGRYHHPQICNPDNLRRVATLLQRTTIHQGDFESVTPYITPKTLIYFDPPYRPISQTASFKSYAQAGFDDHDQARLADFCHHLHAQGVAWLLSNSDPHNHDPRDMFFEQLYQPFWLHRLKAKRAINSNPQKRGEISELLITNYDHFCQD